MEMVVSFFFLKDYGKLNIRRVIIGSHFDKK